MDSPRRSLVKALIWQALGIVSGVLIGAALTGSFQVGGAFALLNASIGLVVYVFYERLWSHLSWGRETRKNPIDPHSVK